MDFSVSYITIVCLGTGVRVVGEGGGAGGGACCPPIVYIQNIMSLGKRHTLIKAIIHAIVNQIFAK